MNTLKKITMLPLLTLALLGGGMVAGYASLASADTATDTSTTAPSAMTGTERPAFDIHKGGHIGKNGAKEELLTGETAAKVTAAATTAVPGGTIDRVETDAEGAVYEAHVTKADGSHVTLKFDANFALTATEDGPSYQGEMGHRHGKGEMPASATAPAPATPAAQ